MKTRTIAIVAVIVCMTLTLGGMAACAGFLFVSYRNLDAEASPRIDEVFAAMGTDSYSGTYDTHMSAEFQNSTPREKYLDIGRIIQARLGKLKSKSLRQFNVRSMPSGTYATVAYLATFEKGTGTINASIKKEGGKWLIVGFNVNSSELQKDMVTAICPHCGEPHTANAKFCPKCGKSLEKEASSKEKAM